MDMGAYMEVVVLVAQLDPGVLMEVDPVLGMVVDTGADMEANTGASMGMGRAMGGSAILPALEAVVHVKPRRNDHRTGNNQEMKATMEIRFLANGKGAPTTPHELSGGCV
ncbi:unnamed protein product [Caretta caretta]